MFAWKEACAMTLGNDYSSEFEARRTNRDAVLVFRLEVICKQLKGFLELRKLGGDYIVELTLADTVPVVNNVHRPIFDVHSVPALEDLEDHVSHVADHLFASVYFVRCQPR
jgi:hypothetical protein